MRYDPKRETASFLVLETDWEALHEDTVLILTSSSVSCTSNAVKLKRSCKATTNNARCFADEAIDMKGRNTRAREETMLRSKRRKSRLARNLSCVSVSCMSDTKGRGLQKYDSCYRLEILTSQDITIHNSGHINSSRDCLVSTETNTVRFFQSGIDSPSFQLKDDVTLGRKLADDVIVQNSSHAIDDEVSNVAARTERVDDIEQFFGFLDVTLVKAQTSKTDHLEVGRKQTE